MIIQQLSIFLENKTGRLAEVTELLGSGGVNMSAFSVADTSEFGILRLIVSDPSKGVEILKKAGFIINVTDVICLSCANTPGALSLPLSILDGKGVEIEYLYAFSVNDKALVVIKPDSVERAIEVLESGKVEVVPSGDVYSL